MAPKKEQAPGSEPVGIGSKLRKLHPWFEMVMQPAKDAAIKARQKSGRTKGSQLSPGQLRAVADELEEVQRQLNPLEERRSDLTSKLLAHWAHTGVEEVEHTLGKTLISASFELALDPVALQEAIGESMWRRVTARVVQPAMVLRKDSPAMRAAVEKAARVRKLKVSVTPPSSRRSRSGAPEVESEEENA